MKKFHYRKSEFFFFMLGIGLVLSSWYFFSHDTKLTPTLIEASTDPFKASYSFPIEKTLSSGKISLQMIEPAPDAVIDSRRGANRRYSVHFKFDALPANLPCTLITYFRGKKLSEKHFANASNGHYEVVEEFEAPGLYEWQVQISEITGILRSFTIKN